MSPRNHRHLRVGEEIAHEINSMLVGELKDPRLEGWWWPTKFACSRI